MEGCPDSFAEVLETVIALIAGGMQDSDAPVKKAACLALSNLGEYLGDDVSEYHGQLMPHLFRLLQDPREDVQRFACIATDFLIENIGSDEIRAYSESLMTILLQLLQQPLESASLEIKSSAVGTIGTIAHVMGADFMAYFNHVIPFLVNYCELIDVSQLSLRSMAMDVTATIASSIGAQTFSPFLEGFMTAAVKGLSLDNCRLRECTYVFFGQVLGLYEDDSQGIANRYLDVIVTELFKSINLSEEDVSQRPSTNIGDGEDEEDASLYVNSAVIEEKEAACDTLSLIFKHAKGSFAKYLEPSVQIFHRLSQHEHENLRKAAVVSLYRVLETMYEMSSGGRTWTPGFDNLSVSYNFLDANFMQLLGMIIEISISIFDKEDDRMVVAALCSEMGEKLKVKRFVVTF